MDAGFDLSSAWAQQAVLGGGGRSWADVAKSNLLNRQVSSNSPSGKTPSKTGLTPQLLQMFNHINSGSSSWHPPAGGGSNKLVVALAHRCVSVQSQQSAGSGRSSGERDVYSFDDNITVARRRPEDAEDNSVSAVSTADNIREHAYNRVQVFWGQLVAYAGTNVRFRSPDRVRLGAVAQHGEGADGWQAAHFAQLPHLQDYFIDALVAELTLAFQQGRWPSHLERKLEALGMPARKIAYVKKHGVPEGRHQRDALFADMGDLSRLLSDACFLFHSMNATTELPAVVNWVDGIFDRQDCRLAARDILERVSLDELPPYEGLREYVVFLQRIFMESREQTLEKITIVEELQRQESIVHRLEQALRRGRRGGQTQNFIDYAAALLRIILLQKRFKRLNGRSITNVSFKDYFASHRPVFLRLGNLFPNDGKNIRKIDNVYEMRQQIGVMIAKYGRYPVDSTNPLHLLAGYELVDSLEALKAMAYQYLGQRDEVKMFLANRQVRDDTVSWLRDHFYDIPDTWEVDAYQPLRELMQRSLLVIDLQHNGTRLPPQALLSGRLDGGVRRAMTDEELLEQQIEIMRRQSVLVVA